MPSTGQARPDRTRAAAGGVGIEPEGAAGEDLRARGVIAQGLARFLERQQSHNRRRFAHDAGDQLGDQGPEIDNENLSCIGGLI